MCQQTRVATVIPYYVKWMEKWPTAQALANASEDEVMNAWAGLGYYSRARNLHASAKKILADYNGEVPNSLDGVLTLPGVGKYTAGAILSSYYGNPTPAVDGNIMRVLSRLGGIQNLRTSKSSIDFCDKWIQEAMKDEKNCDKPQSSPDDTFSGSLIEGLMELGATTCLPVTPDCTACPLSKQCMAYQIVSTKTRSKEFDAHVEECSTCISKDIEDLAGWGRFAAKPAAKEKKEEAQFAVAIVHKSEQDNFSSVLIRKRPNKGLLAGMRELPYIILSEYDELSGVNDLFKNCESVKTFLNELDVDQEDECIDGGEIEHMFSHRVHKIKIAIIKLKDDKKITTKFTKDSTDLREEMVMENEEDPNCNKFEWLKIEMDDKGRLGSIGGNARLAKCINAVHSALFSDTTESVQKRKNETFSEKVSAKKKPRLSLDKESSFMQNFFSAKKVGSKLKDEGETSKVELE